MRPIPAAIAVALAAILVQMLSPIRFGALDPKVQSSVGGDGPDSGSAEKKNDPVLTRMAEAAGIDAGNLLIGELNCRYLAYLVTIPDPEKTRLSLYFDRWIDSIQRAAEHAGYGFDTFWLPWKLAAPAGGAAASGQGEDRSKFPGVLIFRGPDNGGNRPSRLAIFLVGETPSHGVNAAQLAKVTAYYQEGLALQGIVGPSFSGSFDSLNAGLPADTDLRNRLRIVSGTATDPASTERFHSLFPKFETTVRHDGQAMAALKAFLSRHAVRQTTLAILHESGTAYGSQFRSARQPDSSEKCDWRSPAGKLLAASQRVRTLSIQFPREISAIRNAYQEDSAPAAKTPGLPEDLALRLSLKDPQKGSDTVPLLSGAAGAATQESILFQIASTLRGEKADYVVIAATNVLDVLFLGRFLRKTCPDIRLVLLEADALFVRPPDSASFLGSLAVSSYPLFLDNQGWLEPTAEWRHAFASSSTEGVYNAMLSILGDGRLIDYRPPEGRGSTPPIWVAMVGRDRYWPLAYADQEMLQNPACPLGSHGAPLVSITGGSTRILPPAPTNLWLVTFLGLVAACVAFASISRYASRARVRFSSIASFYLPPPGRGSIVDQGRAYYQMLMCLSLLGMMVIMTGPIFWAPNSGPVHLLLCTAGSAAVMGFLGWEVLRIYRGYILTGSRFTKSFTTGVLLFHLGAMGLWMWALLDNDWHEGRFLMLRTFSLNTGVAPAVPLLLACGGFLCWCWVHWQRMISACERKVMLPRTFAPEVYRRAVHIGRHLDRPFQLIDRRALLITSGVFGLFCVTVDTFEYGKLDLLSRQLLGGVAGLLAVNYFMFLRIWWKFRDLLERLELLPIRIAFAALPEELGRTSLWDRAPYRRNYTLLVREVECLNRLMKKCDWYVPGLPEMLAELRTSVDVLTSLEASGLRASPDQQRHARTLSCDIAAVLAQKLDRTYWKRGFTDKDPNVSEPHQIAEEFVALHYTSFIRYVMLGLRNYINSVVAGFVILTLALNAYPFHAAGRIRWVVTVIFLGIGGGLVVSLIQMDRNAILSRLTHTTAGKLDLQFVVKIASIGLLPLITAVGSQFPELARLVVSWVQPAISALK